MIRETSWGIWIIGIILFGIGLFRLTGSPWTGVAPTYTQTFVNGQVLHKAIDNSIEPQISNEQWQDTFVDDKGLRFQNQTLVSDGVLHLNGNVNRVWRISDQADFEQGELSQVDTKAFPGAVQLANKLAVSPNLPVSNASTYHILFESPTLVSDGDQTLHLAWTDLFLII